MGTLNITNEIPITDITMSDYSQTFKENITLYKSHLQSINIVTFDLEELQYASHKLNQFDEQFQQQLNKPFIIQQDFLKLKFTYKGWKKLQ